MSIRRVLTMEPGPVECCLPMRNKGLSRGARPGSIGFGHD